MWLMVSVAMNKLNSQCINSFIPENIHSYHIFKYVWDQSIQNVFKLILKIYPMVDGSGPRGQNDSAVEEM